MNIQVGNWGVYMRQDRFQAVWRRVAYSVHGHDRFADGFFGWRCWRAHGEKYLINTPSRRKQYRRNSERDRGPGCERCVLTSQGLRG